MKAPRHPRPARLHGQAPAGGLVAVAALAAALLALFLLWRSPFWLLLVLLGVGLLATLLIYALPRLILHGAEQAHRSLNRRVWQEVEGHHHSFGGISVAVQDDGSQVWMDGQSLKRLLARPEADDVLAARISGLWRHDDRGRLWLRVDGVVAHLARFPGRMDPRVQKLRRWLERDVLYPAARRHAQASSAATPDSRPPGPR